MTSRITKSKPARRTALKISVFPELPGAVFVGTPSDADLEIARHMQRIRADYESDDCQATLWHELTRMNCDYDEIAAAILNPATLTSCVYLSDWRDAALLPALVAA